MSGEKGKEPLEDQVGKLLMELSKGHPMPTPQKRSQVVQEILGDLKSSFLNCTVLPYGLDEVGVSEDSTALYLSVDTYGKVDTSGKSLHGTVSLNPASHSVLAQQIFKILNANPSSYYFISLKPLTVYANTAFGSLIPAPLPEISFVHTKTNGRCKIRLENYFSVQKTRLFNFYSRVEVRFWPLLMLVRHWGNKFGALRSADILDFDNYALTLLLIHFLVTRKIIPSLKQLQLVKDSAVDRPFIVNNYELSFCTNVATVKPLVSADPMLQDKELRNLSIVSILKGFFQYYSMFDFKEHVICPYLGETLTREIFYPRHDQKNIPEGLKAPYLNGIDGKNRPEKLYLVGPICIQDVFELTSNVTRQVTEEEVLAFTSNCERTGRILEDVLQQSGKASFSDVFS